ncbi:MAG: glycosyltransferase family 39 protein [Bryobacteraceae bacterium]
MQEASKAQPSENWPEGLWSFAGRAWERTLQSPGGSLAIVAALIGVSFVARAVSAGARPFWFDELFTVLIAGLPQMTKVREVLETGADAMPVFYYWLEAQAARLPLDPHIAFRLPSIAGYGLAIAGVCFFVRKWLGPTAGLIGALVLALSPFREYAIEARPYALMVGFLAAAAAFWQQIEESWTYPLLFGASLAFGEASHYYTAVALLCFGMAEASVLWFRRQWRWRAWIPLAFATVPFWLGLPLLLRFRQVAGPNYWAKPHWTGITSTFPLSGLPLAYFVPLVLAVSLALISWSRLDSETLSGGFERGRMAIPQMVLSGSLLMFPVILLLVAHVSGGGYTLRYNWPFIVGFAILCGLASQLFLRPRMAALMALALVLSLFFREVFEFVSHRGRDPRTAYLSARNNLAEAAKSLEKDLPIVAADMMECLPLHYYYGDAAVVKRLYVLVDVESSRRYMGNDTVAHAVLGLDRILPLKIWDTEEFLATHRRFYVWSPRNQSRWVLHYLNSRGLDARIAAGAGREDLFFLVESSGGADRKSTVRSQELRDGANKDKPPA